MKDGWVGTSNGMHVFSFSLGEKGGLRKVSEWVV